jgi:hypothetical protein
MIVPAPPQPPLPPLMIPVASPSPPPLPPMMPFDPVDILTFNYDKNMAYAPAAKTYDVRPSLPPSSPSPDLTFVVCRRPSIRCWSFTQSCASLTAIAFPCS